MLSSIDEDYSSISLSQEDKAYNLVQIKTSSDGFLLKNPTILTEDSTPKVNFIEHEVKEGESLEDIAREYELNVSTIVQENNIINVDEVLPGDTLKILPGDGLSHKVKRGDTLTKIASLYSIDVKDLQQANVINGPIQIGQNLFVPGGVQITKVDIKEEPTIIASNTEPAPAPQEVASEPVKEPVIVASLPTDTEIEEIPNLPETSQLQPKEVPDQEVEAKLPQRGDIDISQSIVTSPDPEIFDLPAVDPGTFVAPPVSIEAPASLVAAPVADGIWGKVTEGTITNGYKAGHYALDIAKRSKPPIWAAKDGVIETAKYGWNGGYGNYIIINHGDGYKTLYAHNEVLYVEEGAKVVKGQQIAKMGNTGRVYGATGIHLHYECIANGEKINPHTCMAKL